MSHVSLSSPVWRSIFFSKSIFNRFAVEAPAPGELAPRVSVLPYRGLLFPSPSSLSEWGLGILRWFISMRSILCLVKDRTRLVAFFLSFFLSFFLLFSGIYLLFFLLLFFVSFIYFSFFLFHVISFLSVWRFLSLVIFCLSFFFVFFFIVSLFSFFFFSFWLFLLLLVFLLLLIVPYFSISFLFSNNLLNLFNDYFRSLSLVLILCIN